MKNKFKTIIIAVFTVCLWDSVAGQDGGFDLTFNGTGKFTKTATVNTTFKDIAVQADGKLVSVGNKYVGTSPHLCVTRVLSNGTLDAGFGTGGEVSLQFYNESYANSVLIKPDGKILIAAQSAQLVAPNSYNMMAIQFNANGTLDNNFGINGVFKYTSTKEVACNSVKLLNDGKMLLAGNIKDATNKGVPSLIKITANGLIDNTFGVNGLASLPITESTNDFMDVVIQSDGKIVCIGNMNTTASSVTGALLARFNSNGTLDNTYGVSGKISKIIGGIIDRLESAVIYPNNDVVVCGTMASALIGGNPDPSGAYKAVLLKYNSTGQPVTTFGSSGQVLLAPVAPSENNGNESYDMALQPDGKIVIGGATDQGSISGNQNCGVWRLSANGVLDNTFGTNGLVKFDQAPAGGPETVQGVAVQEDGKIVVASYGKPSATPPSILVAFINRLNTTLPAAFTLNLTALIEGLYNGSTMISDAVTVELRNATSPYAIIATKTVNLSNAGISTLKFYSGVSNSVPYYIVVRHRNSIQTWSATAVSFASNALTYNFTTAANKAFGSNMILKSGKYCIYSGDVNQDGAVDLSDMTPVDNDSYNFVSAYIGTDLNGDTAVDLSDMTTVDNNSYNFVGVIKPN